MRAKPRRILTVLAGLVLAGTAAAVVVGEHSLESIGAQARRQAAPVPPVRFAPLNTELPVSSVVFHRALRHLRRERRGWRFVHVRTCKYLNNIVEQDHRANQATMQSHARLQVLRLSAGDDCGHRVGASDPQAAVRHWSRLRRQAIQYENGLDRALFGT